MRLRSHGNGSDVHIDHRSACGVCARVKNGRYNNAGEVVREARRRMEQEDERAMRLPLRR